jgi:hypothetical protein
MQPMQLISLKHIFREHGKKKVRVIYPSYNYHKNIFYFIKLKIIDLSIIIL